MNYRNNFFQNNNVPGYQSPIGYNYNNQLHGRVGASMNNANVPVPNNNVRPYYDVPAAYPSRFQGYAHSYRNPVRSYHGTYMPENVPNQGNYDGYNNYASAPEAVPVRSRYNNIAEPFSRERRRWTYSSRNTLDDSYNYDDYHDDPVLRDEHSRSNYRSRFFTKLINKNKRSKYEDDERDNLYSSREEELKRKRKVKSKSRYEDEYDDEEYDDEEDEYDDERDGRKRKSKKSSRSRYEDEYDDEEYDDEEDEYDDERDGRKRKSKKSSRSRYEDEYDDYDDEVYESRNRKSRFVSGPIDFFKKKRRV